jgi:WD40 repeat protein/transcriptional regulator with XRE-family HTH domain
MPNPPFSIDSFQTFGELLKYLRRRERLTQLELSITVGYSEAQIGRLEKNQRKPDLTALKALFIPALHLEDEPELMAHFLEMAKSAKQEDAPTPGFAPYKGLLFFDESDADLFFGREVLTTRLTDRVTNLAADASTRFLAVVGASGSGKSSLVRAGLVAALKNSGWDIHVFTPGADPLKALEMQLDSNQAQAESDRVLILVDQFEETFTLCHDETERVAFIEKLLEVATLILSPLPAGEGQRGEEKIMVVIALRADFYSHCAQYPLLRNAVAAEQEYIGQMTTEELRRAIEEPAKHGGWEFEPGLVDVLLQDIGAQGTSEPEPGALPLLSHALLATWEHRRGKTFTLDGYRASGGVRSAIAETAESVFTDQLNQQQQELARDVFLRLTELGEGTEDTRRRAALNELVRQSAEATQLRTVLNTLAEARLITLNEDSAEVAHEALIREWQRLHEWLTQDRDGLRLHRHLTESVREWETRGHDLSELYRGARLAQAREWAGVNEGSLNEAERAFLETSIGQEQHDALEREAQRQRELEAAQKLAATEHRTAKQLRRRAVFLAAAFVLAIALASVAFLFSHQATASAKTAQAEQQIAFERELSASAANDLSVDPELGILLSLQAVNTSLLNGQPVLIESQDALHRSIQASHVLATLRGDSAGVYSVVASRDGKRLATLSDNGTLKIWDAASNQKLLSIPTGLTEQNVLRFISFSPGGKRLAAPAGVHLVKVWDVATGKELLTLSGHTDEVTTAIFSPDGTRIATGSWDTTAKLWDAGTGKDLMTFKGHENGIATLAFSPDGNRLYTGSDADGVGIAWDIASGKQLFTFDGEGGLDSIVVSPDGTRLATGEFDTTLKIWDAATGNKLLTFFGHASYLNGVVYSPDGKQLASTSEDGMTKLWDAETGKALLTLSGHTSGVQNVAFSPDGNKLYTASRDGTVKIWDVSPLAGSDWLNLAGHTNRVRSVAYRPDGKQLATLGYDGALKIWDAVSGKELLTITLTHMVNSMNSGGNALAGGVSYSPDSKRLAYNDLNITKIVDANSGTEILSLASTDSAGNDVAFSPDGTQIAVGSADAGIVIYNSSNGKRLIQLQTGSGYNGRIVFSPDGKRIASANDDGANVWDVITGKKLVTFSRHGEGVALNGIAYSPNGKWIATSGNDATIKVWDSETGAEIFTLIGHTGPTFGVAFSPDGQYLATSSVDRTVKVWKLPKVGEQIPEPLTLYGNTGAVYQVAFSPDGTRIVSVGRDHIVRIYELNIEELIAIAQSRLTRELTGEECQKYLHMSTCPTQP